ncbi:DNA-binding transcriptional LysR family regulator [Inquilinus ginsengisoli]|uniref:DNA-binding transcriptional LysR family regulator n=1 Tax=Inquilinus ginsengisoli TaxID=363840 RepID=A0ABU1JYE8_9PROT|nr:LysR family transcriptional regulator [Inquilinus ginsengisoli]MDR6293024.1 DNA-binding transcriptional LysR family regulator [Inquilinus ginsengisoli]
MTTGEPNWDDIRIFLAVARTGSLTEAARHLQLSQPTVGRRLRVLEGQAGARLFDRLPNRLQLTALGQALVESAGSMEAGAGALARRLRQSAATGQEPVQVTATSSVSLFVTTHLQGLLAESGRVIALGNSRAQANLARREADIALRMRRTPEEGDLAARRIGRIGFALYAARSYAQHHGLTPDGSLAGLPFIGLPKPERSPSQSAWLDGVARQGTILCRLGEVFLRHRAVADGLGVSLLPCFLGDADDRLLRLGEPVPELAEEVYLMLHAELRRDPGVRAVAEALAGLFRRERGALDGTRRG